MAKKMMRVGIIPREEYWKRTIAIAKGEYVPKRGGPKIWFESLQAMAQVLSSENQQLLKTIIDLKPKSIKELESITGRKSSNLSRTLKTMERYGIVEPSKQKKTIAPFFSPAWDKADDTLFVVIQFCKGIDRIVYIFSGG
jgi:predicted transcriptional regulator